MLERLARGLEHFGVGETTVSWIRSGHPPEATAARDKTRESLPEIDEKTREELRSLGYVE